MSSRSPMPCAAEAPNLITEHSGGCWLALRRQVLVPALLMKGWPWERCFFPQGLGHSFIHSFIYWVGIYCPPSSVSLWHGSDKIMNITANYKNMKLLLLKFIIPSMAFPFSTQPFNTAIKVAYQCCLMVDLLKHKLPQMQYVWNLDCPT